MKLLAVLLLGVIALSPATAQVAPRVLESVAGSLVIVGGGKLPDGVRAEFFKLAGGTGFQRPFELATLRLRNMAEVIGNWQTYVPNPAYLTQRGGTFLFDNQGKILYEHRDRGILGFAANMSQPLSFLRF